MFAKYNLFVFIVVLCFSYLSLSLDQVKNDVKVTNFECVTNKKIIPSPNCTLKAVRGKGNLLYASCLLTRKLYAVTLHATISQWKSGYRPFLIDMEMDCCKLLSKRNINQVQNLIRNFLAYHSNINHSCPYEGYLLAPGVQPSLGMIPSILVTGKYRLLLNFSTEGEWIGYVDIHCDIKSDLKY